MADKRCPGEKGTVDDAICRGRQTRKFHKCPDCEHRDASLQSAAVRPENDPRHKVFKAYDIRGVYPEELDENLAEKIGMAAARFLNPGTLVVSRDMRVSSIPLARALINGILTSGCNVLDIGMASTDANYFAIGHYRQGGGIQVTASHNPPEYNGFKLSREQAIPMSYETGIANVERLALGAPMRPVETRGKVETRDIMNDWKRHVLSFARNISPLKVVIDAANGMAGKMLPPILAELPLQVTELYFKPDGTFPNHEANPLKAENLVDLQKAVREKGADLGVAFDGDADRCVFVDETGAAVSSDLVTALFAPHLLRGQIKPVVVYDLRSSHVVSEEIRQAGGTPVRDRVGHSFMKATMRQRNAVYGGELSGHFYWRENFFADSGHITMIQMLNILSAERRAFSELLKPLRRYHSTGEVNFDVEDKSAALTRLAKAFKEGRQDTLDGLTVEYDDWWFNVRPSNTEPKLRLNLEANTAELMEQKKAEVVKVIRD